MLQARCTVLLSLAVLASACGPAEPPEGAEVIHVAVGAVVTLRVDGICRGDLLSICVPEVSEQIVDATLVAGNAFELLEVGAVDTLTVRATQLGYSQLTVHYRDWRGEIVEGQAWLHAAEITDTLLRLRCDGSSLPDADGLAIATGARFSFDAQAVAGETWLASGGLPLVSADAFAIEANMATAPAAEGEYVWALAGGREIQILVYEASQLRLGLTDFTARLTTLEIQRLAGDAPVCVHGRSERAEVRVTAGSCRPLLESGVEVEGPLPISLAHGDVEVAFVGEGPCTVEASVGGAIASHSFDVVREERAALPSTSGTPLGTASVFGQLAPTEACTLGGTDGDCDYLAERGLIPTDFDCYLDSRWQIEHADGSATADEESVLPAGAFVGVGLTTELRLEVRGVLFGLLNVLEFGPPHDLNWSSTPGGGLGFETLGCRPDASYEVFRVQTLVAGRHDFTFTASNLADVGRYAFEARNVERAVYDVGGASESEAFTFVESELALRVTYALADGTPLRGIAPLQVASDNSSVGAEVSASGVLYTGTSPHTITLSSPPAPNVQTTRVVDGSAVAQVELVPSAAVAPGAIYCTPLRPSTAAGARIHGTPPARPRVTWSGSAVTANLPAGLTPLVLPESHPDACAPPCLCVEGFAVGSSSARVDWGTASATSTIAVQ